MRLLVLLLLVSIVTACAGPAQKSSEPPVPTMHAPLIHPLALHKTLCWLSDTEEPEYTEINISAIESNRNQYDYNSLILEDGWYIYRNKDKHLFIKVRIEEMPKHYSYYISYNTGGNSNYNSSIHGIFTNSTIYIDDQKKAIRVFKIIRID